MSKPQEQFDPLIPPSPRIVDISCKKTIHIGQPILPRRHLTLSRNPIFLLILQKVFIRCIAILGCRAVHCGEHFLEDLVGVVVVLGCLHDLLEVVEEVWVLVGGFLEVVAHSFVGLGHLDQHS